MSLIEKLKNLLNEAETLEELENTDNSQVEEASDSTLNEIKEEVPVFPAYLECSEEETLKYLEMVSGIKEVKFRLADLICSFDKMKNDLKTLAKEKENETYILLAELKKKYNVPDKGYTISLPSHISEGKVRFEKEE